MPRTLKRIVKAPEDSESSLQREIAALEAELVEVRTRVSAFEGKIRSRLDREIARIQELAALYKSQKKAKKAKRLEQKKRGKNYVEPKQLVLRSSINAQGAALSPEDQKTLRRLYKEAVVKVHPDKLMHSGEQDKIDRANAITAQLNSIYQRGDLEELFNFYQFVINGIENQDKHENTALVPGADHKMEMLVKQKEGLARRLEQLKASYTYMVLMSYENPDTFIDELYLQFQERIKQLEKRTRVARTGS